MRITNNIHYIKWVFVLCFALNFFNKSLNAVEHCDFVLITPYKTGTHLVIALLESLLDKNERFVHKVEIGNDKFNKILDDAKENNKFVRFHALPNEKFIQNLQQRNYKVIFIWRDPRDQAVSLLFFILDESKKFAYKTLARHKSFGKLSFDNQLLEIITGIRYGVSGTKDIMGTRIPWMHQDSSFVYTTKFEDLVGSKGGGSDVKQMIEIMNIARFLEVNLSKEEILERTKYIYGVGGTFRSGKIGEWKKYFKPQHVKGFKNTFGQELIDTGYEKDFQWCNFN